MRNIDRRKLLKAIGVSGAVGVAGCSGNGGTSTEGGSNSNPGSSNAVEITYRDRDDPQAVYADVFNKSHNDVHVKASMKPPEEKYRSLIAQIQAGNAPEVVGLDVIYLPRFVELNTLANLDSFYQELPYTDDIFEPLTKDFIRWNDTVYGLPFWIDCSAYLYNKAHFEEAGLDPDSPPETFSEFIDAARTIKENTDYTPLSLNLAGSNSLGLEVFFYMPHVWASGGKLFNDEMTKSLIDEQPAVDALEFFVTLQEEGLSSDQTSNEDWTTVSLMNGDASMAYSDSGIGNIRKEAPDLWENLGVAMFPKPEGGTQSSFLGGNSIVIPKQVTKNEEKFDAAKQFVKWVNTEEGMRTTVEELGFLPARQSGFETDYVKENQEHYEPFRRAMEQGHAPPMHPRVLEMQQPLNDALARALLGDQEPQAALSDAATAITNILQSK